MIPPLDRFGMDRSIYYLTLDQFTRIGTDEKFDCCTLYDRKNRTNSYDFLRIKQVHAVDLSDSFKPMFVVIAFIIDMTIDGGM